MRELSGERCLISFSGGETSAYMTYWLLRQKPYVDTKVVFANTGQENEQTLNFVRLCDEHFGFNTVWIEGVQFHNERKNPGFRVVDYQTANREGVPFEDFIKKSGIPNAKFKACTRALKQYPIEAFAKSVGWKNGSYDIAIGIRADEIDRLSSGTRRTVYPLASVHPRTKPQINAWWASQPFRLELKGYQGNCKWCWKKSLRKHYTIIMENPEAYDFPRRMEKLYGTVGPEFVRGVTDGYRRVFFRKELSTEQLFKQYEQNKHKFVPAEDDAKVMPGGSLFDEELDVGAGCEESCEVFADEDQEKTTK